MSVVVQPTNKPRDLQRRGSTTSPLIVPQRNGHRRILKDVFVKESTPGGRIDIKVGAISKVRIRTNLAQAILVQSLRGKKGNHGFLWALAELIPEFPFPTSTDDEDITIEYTAVGGSVLTRIDAYFEDVTEGDVINRNLPGGSQSDKDFLIINLYNSAIISSTSSPEFDFLDLPIGLSLFSSGESIVTGGRRIAASKKFTTYLIAADVPSPGGTSRATRAHLFDEKIELFTSENNEGLFIDPTVDNELEFDLDPAEYFMLPTPYIFEPNRLVQFSMDFTHDAVNNAAAQSQKLFLIGIVETIGGP